MSKPILHTALLASTALNTADGADVPEWVQLLPASHGSIETRDRRGPFLIHDAAQIVANSLSDGEELVIDECHATDIAAPKGAAAPARGWIKEMEVRPDGIWGRVEWNSAGRALVQDRAYRGLSPVILHDKSKRVMRILRASLTNTPNLRGMVALNQEDQMTLIERLAELLGLGADATEEQVMSALEEKLAEPKPELQSQLSQVAVALGLSADAASTDLVTAAQSTVTRAEFDALQAELNSTVTALNEERAGSSRAAAETYVDGEIKRGRAGLKPVRDRYISMHMADPVGAAELIEAMPIIGTPLPKPQPREAEHEQALNAQQLDVAARMGIDPDAFQKALNSQETV